MLAEQIGTGTDQACGRQGFESHANGVPVAVIFPEGIGRIDVDPVEPFAAEQGFDPRRLAGVTPGDGGAGIDTERGDIVTNHVERSWGEIDEGHVGGFARQRLESERPDAAAEVEAASLLDTANDIEQRLPQTRARRTHVVTGQGRQLPAAKAAAGDPEHCDTLPSFAAGGPRENPGSIGMVRLGVNIDHVATVRQARGGREPEPVAAAVLAELGGADQITVHLREDRRHIVDRDVRVLRETVATRLNLEMAVVEEIIEIALEVRPETVTLVPERRDEVTTEGGLDVVRHAATIAPAVARMRDAGIGVSLFVDPVAEQILASRDAGADAIELHTGAYALASGADVDAELAALRDQAAAAAAAGLHVAAGHGLNYSNTAAVVAIESIEELNIGHSIVSRAVMVGMTRAVAEMKYLINRSRPLAAPLPS